MDKIGFADLVRKYGDDWRINGYVVLIHDDLVERERDRNKMTAILLSNATPLYDFHDYMIMRDRTYKMISRKS